jgi:hypothetical protein
MDKKRSLDCISQINSLSPAQGKIAEVKIMLIPSNLNKDEKQHKEESSWQAQVYSYVFYFSLEYSSPYYKEGCNVVILTKPKCSKTLRDSKSDVRKPNSKNVLKSTLPVQPILHIGQTSWTYLRVSLVHRTCLVPLPDSRDVYRTCPILDKTSLVNNMTVGIWASPDKSNHHQTCSSPNLNLSI